MSVIETPKSQYVQIAELLSARIKDGTYPRGSLLPSEDRLATELNVSRVTVNRAIGLLRSSGDVRVERGTGTRVRTLPRIRRDARARYAARELGTGAGQVEVDSLNLTSRTDYHEIGRVTPPHDVAAVLKLRKGEAALVRRRILYANDEPTQLADSYYPWSIAKGSEGLLRADSGRGGSYARLAEVGHGPASFTEDVNVRMPTDDEQRALGLEATQPVFEIWHVAYTEAGRPVEVCIHVMPGHLWTLHYDWRDVHDGEQVEP